MNPFLVQMAIAVNVGMHKLFAHQNFNGEQRKCHGNNYQDDKK
jgi:hypothetical protein